MTEETMGTLTAFIESEGLEMKAEQFTMRPDNLTSTTKRHFKCTFRKRLPNHDECPRCGQSMEPGAHVGYENPKHAPDGYYPRASVQCSGKWDFGPVFSVWFSQGDAWKTPPTAADVLDCIASDASGYDNSRNFEDWCAEYGYDDDSRTAERIYHQVAEQAKQLHHFLGSEAYERLLYKVEP